FNVTVHALDAFWDLASTNDTVQITSSDAGANLPASAALTAGTKTFSVTLGTAGSQTLTASDVTNPGVLSNTSPAITVIAAVLARLQVLMPGETAAPGTASGKTGTASAQVAGVAFNVTVNSVDANWNLINTNDTVNLTSSDTNSIAPAHAALSVGTVTLSVTLKTAGSASVTASDVTHPGITPDTGSSITVNAGAFVKLQLLTPGETAAPGSATGKTGTPNAHTAGTAFTVTVNAVDASWNKLTTAT